MNLHICNESALKNVLKGVIYYIENIRNIDTKDAATLTDIEKIKIYIRFNLKNGFFKSKSAFDMYTNILNYLNISSDSIYYTLFNYISDKYNIIETEFGIVVVRRSNAEFSLNDSYKHCEISGNFKSPHIPICTNNIPHKCIGLSFSSRVQPICYPNGEKIIVDEVLLKSYCYVYSRATRMLIIKKKIHEDTLNAEYKNIKKQIGIDIKKTKDSMAITKKYVDILSRNKFDGIFKGIDIWKLETELIDTFGVYYTYDFLTSDLFKQVILTDKLLIDDFSIDKYKDDLIKFILHIRNGDCDPKIVDKVILNIINTDEFLSHDVNTVILNKSGISLMNYIPVPFSTDMDLFEPHLPKYTLRINPIFNLVNCCQKLSEEIPIDETISHCPYCKSDILCRYHEKIKERSAFMRRFHPLNLEEVIELYNTNTLFKIIFDAYFDKLINYQVGFSK